MAPGLQQLFDDVAADLPPISRGSLRLRVSPSGDRGVWLDFSNEDIKNLLRQRDWIERMRIRGVLEIGQKRKRVVDKIGGLGLGAPEAHPWTLTPLESRDASLYSSIGSFTQAGTRANRAIVSEFLKLIPVLDKPTWLELGAGIGTLTLPLAEKAQKVIAIENDLLALAHLRQSAEAAGLLSRIETVATNFYASTLSFASYLLASHGVVADPPRSGLGIFLSHLAGIEPSARPKHFIYVSCATESFTHDAKTLYSLGYRLGRMVGVDQFPQTPHCEWLSYFYR
jgi:23S rRNA (uracil1939-C5)-methyltransferase